MDNSKKILSIKVLSMLSETSLFLFEKLFKQKPDKDNGNIHLWYKDIDNSICTIRPKLSNVLDIPRETQAGITDWDNQDSDPSEDIRDIIKMNEIFGKAKTLEEGYRKFREYLKEYYKVKKEVL